MLLRTRVSLFVILLFVAACLALVFIGLKREDLVHAQYSDGIISDQSTLWKKINDNLVQRMEDKAWIVTENEAFHKAMEDGDQQRVQQLGAEIAAEIENQGIAGRFDAVYVDGSLAYSSVPSLFQSSIIAEDVARRAVRFRTRIRGIGNDKQRNIAVALGLPLRGSSGAIVGMGIYATDIKEALAELERVTNASLLIANRRGRMLVGPDDSLWPSLDDAIDLNVANTLQTVDSDDRVYSVLVLEHEADLGSLVGRLVSVRDITDLALQQKRVGQITFGVVVGFLALILIALNYYMWRAFSPLTEGVGVLNALSRGDLDAYIEHTGSRDEIGRIISAVDVFRTNLIAVDRIRRSRRRQHNRQERFIRREMTQLADTLDPDEREAVLGELGLLEQEIAEWASQDNQVVEVADLDAEEDGGAPGASSELDSLAMVAVAFQRMSNRVQDQNQRLRDALAAKEAYIALQKELDIASRVQVSFLPPPMPPTEAFDITGFMRPAKEIGGDFYDFFRLDDHRFGMVIADVSGKGVAAALFMAMSRTLIRATAVQTESPGEVLAEVNNLLDQNNNEQLFVTVFYGVLDERTGRFTYANGGHNPPLLSDSQGVRPLALTGGMLLAMFPSDGYDEDYVDLEPGARLILLTDGVTEACNPESEEFGDERLAEVVTALSVEQGPADAIGAIIDAVDAFVNEEPQFDDITCVVMQFKETSESAGPAA
ncbi:MAG: SpoIIE family protein phosphatase [bacterium]